VQHNRSVLEPGPAWDIAIQLYTYVKNLADVVIPQEYGMSKDEKLTIAQVLRLQAVLAVSDHFFRYEFRNLRAPHFSQYTINHTF
jgi:inositol hexakisphosphate/diphosphoinositol-pentakisphosphate kinase